MSTRLERGGSQQVTFTSPQEVIINHEDDSITSWTDDGFGNPITSTSEGGKQGLDVHVTNTTPIPVTGTISSSPDVNVHDGSGTAITSTLDGSKQGLDVHLSNSSIAVTGPLTDTELRASPVDVSAAQSGTWNINDITGTVSLPTNAAQESGGNLDSINSSLSSIDGKLNSLGQKTMTGSVPVVIASDQSPIPVTGSISSSPDVNVHDGSGTAITSTLDGSKQGLDAHISNTSIAVTGPLTDTELRATPVPISGTVTANAGTGNFTVVQATGTNLHTVVDSGTITTITNVVHVDDNGGSLTVDGPLTDVQLRATPVPVSGTVTTTASGTQDTNLIQINGNTVLAGNGVTGTGSQRVTIASDNTAFTVNAAQSGSWTVTANAGTNLNTSLLALDTTVDARSATASNTRVAVTTASTQLLAANANRKIASIFNQSGATLFLKLGAAAVVNQGIRLPNFSEYTIGRDFQWTGTINAISSAGTNTLEVFEGTP